MKEDLSIEQIVKSIKQVILGRNHDSIKSKGVPHRPLVDQSDDDVYELTSLAPEDSAKDGGVFLKQEKNLEQDVEQNPRKESFANQVSSLLSEKSAKETMQHFSSIKQSVNSRQQNSGQTILQGANKTVEDLTIEIMRPYLSQWLDENLPRIVKNLVEQEIKKLVLDENNINRNS
jgi:cell pole-organizing protein PopZ